MIPDRHPGFKPLHSHWNDILNRERLWSSDFYDFCTGVINETGTVRRYLRMPLSVIDAKRDYFQMVGNAVERTELKNTFIASLELGVGFSSLTEYLILALYAEGFNRGEIKRRLNIQGHRHLIYKPIQQWLKTWRIT